MPERWFLDIARAEVRDHRGKPRVVPFLDIFGSPRSYANTPPRASLREIRRRMFKQAWLVGAVLGSAMIVVACGAFALLILIPALMRQTLAFVAAAVLMLIPLSILYELTALRVFRRMYRRIFPDAALAEGFCPHCLYDLRGVTTHEVDGCTICPECASAWRMA